MSEEQNTAPTAAAGTPPAPVAPTTAPKPKWWRNPKVRTAIVVAGAILLIVGKLATAEKRQEHRADADARHEVATYAVGDCVTFGPTKGEKFDISHTDCAKDISYTVGAKPAPGQACPGTSYSEYTWTLHDNTTEKLCLASNLATGHCYRLPVDTHSFIETTECTDPAGYKVAQRLENSADAAQCPPEVKKYIDYPQPSWIYCLAPTQATPAA
ncbi:LppU/SCO3897 family protein [Mycobacteroides salmoniphilum]|uniref:LppU/SCO3897 family protein n=1 Tax=Mycobacteroides salmoniphilum TaxID=404941 RepID=UPI0012FFBD14|nr:hypothetical protein [Mycobacteroides salmoniphilum]